MEHKVVAQIGNSQIKEKDVQKMLEDSYREAAITRIVNDKLIQKEAQRLGYGHLDKEERKKAEKYYKLVYNLKDQDLKKLVENDELELFYHTLLLIKKYTVTEDELRKFWDQEKNNALPPTYHIRVYKDNDHKKLEMIEDKLASGSSLDEIKKEFGADFKKVSVNKEHSIYVSLDGLKPGEFIHSHNYSDETSISEDHGDHSNHGEHGKHEEHSNHEKETTATGNVQESSHAIIILESIERDTDKNFEDNKEEILDFYATKKIYKERIELVNYLKSKYKVMMEK